MKYDFEKYLWRYFWADTDLKQLMETKIDIETILKTNKTIRTISVFVWFRQKRQETTKKTEKNNYFGQFHLRFLSQSSTCVG